MIASLTSLLGISAQDPSFWMPLVLMALLFAIIVAGTVLGGFDVGVGCLALVAPPALRQRMLALLGPWRDANEFWLLLGLGLFVAAFPGAWGIVLGKLYAPLCLLALGVLMRLVAFELRLRAPRAMQPLWIKWFAVGSVMTALANGFVLGRLVTEYQPGWGYAGFTLFAGVCALAGYCLLGACWLIMREDGELRFRAVVWARRTVRWAAAGAVGMSIVLVFANAGVFLKWTGSGMWRLMASLWVVMLVAFIVVDMRLQRMINRSYRSTALPFFLVLLVFLIVLAGLGYSFFPFVVLDDITIWDAAASVSSLRLVLSAAVIALPVGVIFNVWVYWRMFGVSRAPVLPPFRERRKP
jgi:cytochrome d ubiquinol oxidase subunit II